MANYVPKEKKPTLNRESIQRDLKKSSFNPPLLCFTIFILLVISVAGWFGLLTLLPTKDHTPFAWIIYLMGLIIYSILPILTACLFWIMTIDPLRVKLGKFDIRNDTIERKVFREPIRIYGKYARNKPDRHRYPSVLYFKTCGRFAINYDTEGTYGERGGQAEKKAEKRFDEYELEKSYIVVTVGKIKPKIIAVYDPDDYDVQL